MSIKKHGEKWKVDVWPWGRNGKRIRKSFTTQTEAQRFQRYILNKAHTDKEWTPAAPDRRTLRELVGLWFTAHGQYLRDGERRQKRLFQACEGLGEPKAIELKAEHYTHYRDKRIQANISPKTCNNELGYLNAVYNELHRTQVIKYQNPLQFVRMIKISESELTYLDQAQIKELLDKLKNSRSKHVYLVAKLCLSTGCRWSEANRLQPRNLRKHKVTFTDTKSGKNRTIPISPALYDELNEHFKKHGPFTEFTITAFRRLISKTNITLPKGQATHVLRHSFASHFIINGGNILTLQRILGHSTINMTMRYAHLAPDHLEEAVKLNPLQGVDSL